MLISNILYSKRALRGELPVIPTVGRSEYSK